MPKFAPARFSRKTIAVAVALIVGTTGWFVSHPSRAAEEKKPAANVVLELASTDLAQVAHGDLRRPIRLSGSLNPIRQTVLNSQVEAVVAEVLVRPGESVAAGQLLARLDTAELQNLAASRAATLERSRAELKLAEKNRARSADLLKQHFISPNSYDATENSYAVAVAQVKADEAQLSIAQRSLANATVRAPFAGVISDRVVDPGARVTANQKLFGLVELADLEFAADVAMADLPQIKPGQDVVLRVEGFGDRAFNGKVERIAPMAIAGSRMVPIYVRLKNTDSALKGGMFAQGEVIVARDDSTNMLPLSALRGLDTAKPYVLTVESGKVVQHNIKLGLIDDLNKTASIKDGVKTGDLVVIAKLESIKAGQSVKLPTPGKA
jgi:RND family efflux transporter MFP subunit